MSEVAFLGMGLIGAGLAEAALGRGEQVVVHNRTAAKSAPLVALGARAAPDVADAVAGAARVHLALTADAAVDAVLAQLQPALPEGVVVIDHSTTSPAGTAARAERLAGAGVRFLHAPVFMSPTACRNASGVMVAAGPEAAYERVAEALATMTGEVWYVGARPDLAAAYKLMGNALIVSIIGGLADVYAIGRNLGIDGSDCHALFAHFDASVGIQGRGARMAAGNFDTLWSLRMARKDVGLMLDAAGGAEALGLLPALAARMDARIEAGDGERDVGVLAGAPSSDAVR